jgi:hypothetical protein
VVLVETLVCEHHDHRPRHSRRRRPTRARHNGREIVLAAGAIAFGAISMTPAVAFADPNNAPKRTETAIKADCKDAGGDYYKGADSGGNTSHCSYFDTYGNNWIDNYKNGVFTGTSGPYRSKPTGVPNPGTAVIPATGVNQLS